MQRVKEMGLVPVERCIGGHATEVTPSGTYYGIRHLLM